MYEVSKEIIRNIRNEFTDILDDEGYRYSEDAIDTIMETWLERKADLLDLLNKHPKWKPERLMIHFDEDYSRKINAGVTRNFFNWLKNKININDFIYNFMRIWCTCETYLSEDVPQEDLDYLTQINDKLKFYPGAKNTRVVAKICKVMGYDKKELYYKCRDCGTPYEEISNDIVTAEGNKFTRTEYVCPKCGYSVDKVYDFNTEFAKYCDALSPIKVTRHTCISLNPIDYLLMSNGNSWRSCHCIKDASDPGEYSSGTISYMLDNHSIMFYTVDAANNAEVIEREPKIQRQVFGYNDYQLMQLRLYPQDNDCGASSTYTDIRNIMQKVIADCLQMPNLWIKKADYDNVEHGDGATCYPDWRYNDNCNMSVLKEKANEFHEDIVFGTAPICIECGDYHNVTENINCCRKGYCCYHCGCVIDADEVRWIDGEPYCEDCTTWCECCEEYVFEDDATWIPSEHRYVCGHCLNEYYTYCEDCEEYVYYNNVTYIDSEGKYVCNDCLKDGYEQCADCDEYFLKEDMHTKEDPDTGEVKCYCEDCYADYEEEEEDE